MAFEGINFPVYRKYKNNTTVFKIISRFEFEEKQKIGSKLIVNRIEAKQLPEMNQIYDLVHLSSDFVSEITDYEYDAFC